MLENSKLYWVWMIDIFIEPFASTKFIWVSEPFYYEPPYINYVIVFLYLWSRKKINFFVCLVNILTLKLLGLLVATSIHTHRHTHISQILNCDILSLENDAVEAKHVFLQLNCCKHLYHQSWRENMKITVNIKVIKWHNENLLTLTCL